MTRLRRTLTFCILAALFAGNYLLLAEDLAVLEIVAAIGSGLLAVLALRALLNTEPVNFKFHPRWSKKVLHIPWEILSDSVLLLITLPKLLFQKRSHIGKLTQTALAASESSPEAAVDRALATIAASIAPNSYVVEINQGENRYMVHQLLNRDDSAILKHQ